MKFKTVLSSLLSLGLIGGALGWHPTDSVMDGDSAQSGYQPNHNMDPEVIAGGTFGQIWQYKTQATFNGLTEQFFSKPLVYTPARTGRQVVIAFSEQNRIFVIDAVNGTLYTMRDLNSEGESPFNAKDLGQCNDISGTIGITGTPVIDIATETIYFWAKGYRTPGVTGWQNGAYRFHAVDVLTLAERPGFPTNLEGVGADNDATRRFIGGSMLQRPSLNLINGVVYAGFGGHCDQYNYTGWLVGMKASTGSLITAFSTSAGVRANPQDGTWTGGGGGAGIWMGGSILASDNPTRLMFATGNGYKTSVNDKVPARGKDHLDTLGECIVNMYLDPVTGKATQQDYFQPYTYQAMDGGDRDLGSGGVAILPFSGGGVNRLAVTVGKNGQCFVTNADDLGGYKMGPGGGDAILQTITPPSGTQIFGTVGAYPLEGGYMYMTPVGAPTFVYQLGSDGAGRPAFSLAGQTPDPASGAVGTGSAVLTSNKGAPGSGILWIADQGSGIRAYRAVPQNGQLVKITLPPSPNLSKFQRPVFGDGRYYSTSGGMVLGFGSPVSLPFDCSGPLDFGGVSVGQTVTLSVTCKARIAITKITGITIGNKLYTVGNYAAGPFQTGSNVTIPVTFSLAGYQLSGSNSNTTVVPGVQVGSITLSTQNGATGYSTLQPISASANVISTSAFASMSPLQVDFAPVIIGSDAAQEGSDNTVVISNMGKADMTITGYAFTKDSISSNNPVFTNVTRRITGEYILDKDGYFTASDLPPVGTVVKAGSSIVVHMNFKCSTLGNYFSIINVWTNGGVAYTSLTGTASSVPIAQLSYKTLEGGWNDVPACPVSGQECAANVTMGTSVGGLTKTKQQFKIHNAGGSDLVISKSKPPMGSELGAENPTTDFSEGLVIAPGKEAFGTVYFSPPRALFNTDPVEYSAVWTLNTNDLTWGVHGLNFVGTVVGQVVGPLLESGSARFKYSGCYLDSTGSRIETLNTAIKNNTNAQCMSVAVTNKQVFAALEYQTECWTGNNVPAPSRKVADYNCDSYLCPGNANETCGGIGSYATIWYDSTGYFPANNSLSYQYQPPTYKPTVGNYAYVGCRKDDKSPRPLSVNMGGDSKAMTLEMCATKCKGYTFYGAEWGQECWCGNAILGNGLTPMPETDCSMACPGDSHALCGAASRLSIYALNGTVIPTITSSSTSATATSTAKPTYSYVSCYEDSNAARTFNSGYFPDPDGTMTPAACSNYCAGFAYFGVEYGAECFCGNSITASVATDGRCAMTCPGDPSQICGGPDGLSVYRANSTVPNPATVTGTSSTKTGITSTGFATTTTSNTTPATPTVTVKCPDSNGTIYTTGNNKAFLLECFVDHAAGDLSVVYVDSYAQCCETCAVTASCNAFSWVSGVGTPCYLKSTVGDANSNGAIWGAKVVTLPTTSTSSSSTSKTTISISTSSNTSKTTTSITTSTTSITSNTSKTTSSTTSSSSTTKTISPSTSKTSTSTSSTKSTSTSSTTSNTSKTTSSTNTSLSTTKTTSTTTSKTTSATTVSSSTSSTSTTSTTSKPATSTSSTTSITTSKPTSSTTSILSTITTSKATSTSTTRTSTTSSTALSTDWAYYGCAVDSTSGRTLNGTSTTNAAMTPSMCQDFCSSKNYPFAGVEYGTQCYCGLGLAGGNTVGQTGCIMACPGDATQKCGGKSRLDISQKSSYVMPVVVQSVRNPAATTSGGVTNLLGCFADSTTARTLGKMSWKSPTDVTVEACAARCATKTYSVSGVTYGGECYCDTVAPVVGGPLYLPNIYDCMVNFCTGNMTEFCGGKSKILVYA